MKNNKEEIQKDKDETKANDKPSENNVGMPTEIEKASNVVQTVEHN